MKRKDLYEIAKRLEVVKQPGKIFTLVIADNKNRVIDAITEMEKQIEQNDDFKKHLREIEELKRKHAKKDHIGRPEMKPGNYPDGKRGMFYTIEGSENPDSDYRKALRELEIKNKDIILEQTNREQKYWEEYLEEDIEKEFEFRKIKYSEVPKDITQPEMDVIIIFIDGIPENLK